MPGDSCSFGDIYYGMQSFCCKDPTPNEREYRFGKVEKGMTDGEWSFRFDDDQSCIKCDAGNLLYLGVSCQRFERWATENLPKFKISQVVEKSESNESRASNLTEQMQCQAKNVIEALHVYVEELNSLVAMEEQECLEKLIRIGKELCKSKICIFLSYIDQTVDMFNVIKSTNDDRVCEF